MSDEQRRGYPEPPPVGDEASTLVGSLERQRATFEWKCADLTRDGLSMRFDSSELPRPWADVDAATRSEWALGSADLDSPETLYGLWHEAVHRSRGALR